jgi:hypothetical protein
MKYVAGRANEISQIGHRHALAREDEAAEQDRRQHDDEAERSGTLVSHVHR